ncbi:Panacea domain-containing protein [Alloscardovia criceti]|uniref:Panacea domain-containing protein n=1 Tax=Alloscardovia criceti TaxID=356828 RepID=UPI00036039E4|nr:type II toxin-antitoxin system antitoxin SocA domain-containing protein [Alloscardovia criceti]
MKALDIASMFINRYGRVASLTNLTLNKLVYFAQVESLRRNPHAPLFDDVIEAWDYGPVEPEVYNTFKIHGSNRILQAPPYEDSEEARDIVDTVFDKYGWMTAFDMVNYSHREGSAWKRVYTGEHHRVISTADILISSDTRMYPIIQGTLTEAFNSTTQQFKNTLRILGDA